MVIRVVVNQKITLKLGTISTQVKPRSCTTLWDCRINRTRGKLHVVWVFLFSRHNNGFCSSTTILSLLSVAKGMKLMPRIIRHFNTEENLALISVILGNFSHLNVCRNVIYPGSTIANVEEARTQKFVSFDEVELFINTVAPPLLNLISESSLKVVNYLMRIFVERNDIVSVARTKVRISSAIGDPSLNHVYVVAWTCILDNDSITS